MMEAERTCETLVNFYQTTRRYNPEDSHLRCNNCSVTLPVVLCSYEICLQGRQRYFVFNEDQSKLFKNEALRTFTKISWKTWIIMGR
jgi:hypothetical protein